MPFFYDTRHVIDGDTGGGTDDTTAYNDVLANGSTLTFTSINGDQKQVSVTGGSGSSVQAFNGALLDTNTNEVTFSSTTGASADEVVLDLDPMLTPLEALTSGHTTDINLLEAREILKTVTQYPDLTDAQVNAATGSSNNWNVSDYRNRNYEIEGSSKFYTAYPYEAFTSITTNSYWHCGTGTYTTANSSYWDYSGTQSLDGNSGEWLRIKMPDSVILNSFTIQGAYNNTTPEERPRSFKLFGANNGTSSSSYALLGEYNDVDIDYASGTNFKVDSSLAAYGTAYNTYAIVVSKSEGTSFAIGSLRFFSVSKDVSDAIATATTSFYDATITGTNTLNLISDSGTTSLTLPGGTTAATSVDAITFNFTVQTVSGSDKYFLNGMEGSTAPLELLFMHKYIFTFPASHPLKLSRTPDGTHAGGTEWTTGVTVDSTTQITFVNHGMRTLENLYYYCGNAGHSGMGGTIIEENGYNNITEIDYNTTTTIPQLEITRAHGNVIPHLDLFL